MRVQYDRGWLVVVVAGKCVFGCRGDTISRRDVLHGGNLQDGVHFFGGGAGGPGAQQTD